VQHSTGPCYRSATWISINGKIKTKDSRLIDCCFAVSIDALLRGRCHGRGTVAL